MRSRKGIEPLKEANKPDCRRNFGKNSWAFCAWALTSFLDRLLPRLGEVPRPCIAMARQVLARRTSQLWRRPRHGCRVHHPTSPSQLRELCAVNARLVAGCCPQVGCKRLNHEGGSRIDRDLARSVA